MGDEPVPIHRGGLGTPKSRLVVSPQRQLSESNFNDTLVTRCRKVVVANLERYPPEAFGILSEEEWETMVQLRHRKTAPKEGTGGLDGTGRRAPATTDRYLAQVESANPHLAESKIVDELVWRDCVEYRFRHGGLTRPRALLLPWPLLVEQIQSAGDAIARQVEQDSMDASTVSAAIDTLEQSPINVALLKATGIGKTVKKILKRSADSPDAWCQRLQSLLTSWKDLAASKGVEIKGRVETDPSDSRHKEEEEDEDMILVESCQNWRQLFTALKQREEHRRSSQGKRMREIRRNLSQDRPKIVKVRPASAKHQEILDNPMNKFKPAPVNNKVSQLRKEASIVSSRQRGAFAAPAKKTPSSFGAAVAFAGGSKKTTRAVKRKGTDLQLAGGKRMKIPNRMVQGAGPRQLAAKFKKLSK